jgi:hypothetical protein
MVDLNLLRADKNFIFAFFKKVYDSLMVEMLNKNEKFGYALHVQNVTSAKYFLEIRRVGCCL